MPKSPTPGEVILKTLVRSLRERGLALPVIREYLTEKLEREPQPGWPEDWRLVFDDDGHFSLVTADGKIDVDEAVLKLTEQTAPVEEPATETETTHLTKAQENQICVDLAAQELKKDPCGWAELWGRVKDAGPWKKTFGRDRFRNKVVERAYKEAELPVPERGRPPNK
jgi:hypothetical protein